ncbi:MAG: hypothetical protein WC966_09010 [Bradymonadales bacterium]
MSKPSSLELETREQEKTVVFFIKLDLRYRTQGCMRAAQVAVEFVNSRKPSRTARAWVVEGYFPYKCNIVFIRASLYIMMHPKQG